MDKEIYYKIYQYMVNEILWEGWQFMINLEEGLYVSIFRRMDGDIDVSMYADWFLEEDLDWGWVIDMEDETTVDDMNNNLDKFDVDSIQVYIRDKVDFAYQLCFTW